MFLGRAVYVLGPLHVAPVKAIRCTDDNTIDADDYDSGGIAILVQVPAFLFLALFATPAVGPASLKGREDSPLWENARVGPGPRNDARSHRTAARFRGRAPGGGEVRRSA